MGGRAVLAGLFALTALAVLAAPSFALSPDVPLNDAPASNGNGCTPVLASMTDCAVAVAVAGADRDAATDAVLAGGDATVDPDESPDADLTLVLTNAPATPADDAVAGAVAAEPVQQGLAAVGLDADVARDGDLTANVGTRTAVPTDADRARFRLVEDHEYLARAGHPFLLNGFADDDAYTRAPGPATVPPPVYDATTTAVVGDDVESQGTADRRLVDGAVRGALAEPEVAAAVAAGLALLTLVPWALYHRIRGNETLTNKTRKAIYDAICDTPGIGVQEAADVAGVTYSTAGYHLDRLVSAGMLVASANGSRLRYYKNGGFSEAERRIVPILENPEACRVLQAILDSPWTYRAAIAQKLGVSTTTVNWHLKRLLKADLVTEVKEGRSVHLYVDREKLAEVVLPVVEKMGEPPAEAKPIIARAALAGDGVAASAAPA